MAELGDLNATGMGLSAVSGGLQGLLEAYKMKMAQQVQQAQINQSGLNAGAAARAQAEMMMPYREGMLNQQAAALAEKTQNDMTGRRIQALTSGAPDPYPNAPGAMNGPSAMSFIVRDYLNGNSNPMKAPKTGPQAMMFAAEVNKQTGGLGANESALQSAWNQKMQLASPASLVQQRAVQEYVDHLETMRQMVPYLGLGTVAGADAIGRSTAAKLASLAPGTWAKKYVSLAGPGQAQQARADTGRYSLGEMKIFDKQSSLDNIAPDLNANLIGQENSALERGGLVGKYTPKAIPGYLPDAPKTPMGTLNAALPSSGVAQASPSGSPAPTVNWQDYAQ